MARIDWIEQRLQNWARWRMAAGGGGVLGYAAVGLGEANAGRSGYITAPVPILEAEASDTDDAVQVLNPPGLKLTVYEVYCGPGGISDKAARLCCAVPTVYSRVDQAHVQMAAFLIDRQTRRRAERARVEQVQQRARKDFSPLD